MTESNYTDEYKSLLTELLCRGIEQANERTGAKVKAAKGARVIQIDLSNTGLLPMSAVRVLRPATAAAEVAWFVSGSSEVADLEALGTRIWSKFADRLGRVESAYGYRWRKHFGVDQIQLAVRALKKDPSSRQVVVTAWDPRSDGNGQAFQPKNIPCPTQFTLSLVGGYLHSSILLRSSDVFVGLPYDIMGHALLCQALALTQGAKVGVLTFTLAHAHLYECHWEMAREAVRTVAKFPAVPLPMWDVYDVQESPKDYVAVVRRLAERAEWPSFDPKPEVVL